MKAVLVCPILYREKHISGEIAALAKTAGLEVEDTITFNLPQIDSRTFIGKGKVEEIKLNVTKENIVVFDREISPNQQRNLEKELGCKVIDRTELILEIFAQRAQTKEASLQVEIASIQYQMPRLTKLWTHFSRQKVGGKGGHLKGEGEKQIEIDRRLLKKKGALLQKRLLAVRKIRATQRSQREENSVPQLALVGYTNAGKSSLLNVLTSSQAIEDDSLFCTLDTTTRQCVLPSLEKVLCVDTVGFIHNLPTTLVEAFKSTLEEVCHTDVLLHVIDGSDANASEHVDATYAILKEINALDKPIITVINKCDKDINEEELESKFPGCIFVSTVSRAGLDDLSSAIQSALSKKRVRVTLHIPQKEYAFARSLQSRGTVHELSYDSNIIIVDIDIPVSLLDSVEQYRSY